jgi:hypothetical protein
LLVLQLTGVLLLDRTQRLVHSGMQPFVHGDVVVERPLGKAVQFLSGGTKLGGHGHGHGLGRIRRRTTNVAGMIVLGVGVHGIRVCLIVGARPRRHGSAPPLG